MEHHNLFHILSAIILVGAIMIAATTGFMRAVPFFLFAVATTLRGLSLHKGHQGMKVVAYAFFVLGIAWLIWTFWQ
jgi:hypothetical protein